MHTTIRLNDDLLKEAKRQAAESGLTLTALIEDSLRERLSRSKGLSLKLNTVRLKTAGSGGLLPGSILTTALRSWIFWKPQGDTA